MIKSYFPFILFLAASFLLTACYYDVEEELYPNDLCELENLSFAADIQPILQAQCNGCHFTGSALGGGIVLDNYDGVKFMVDNNRLLGSIRREAGFSPMPQGQPQLGQCNIDKIAAWVEAGAPNN